MIPDYSALSLLAECPRKYELKIVRGLTPFTDESPYLRAGSAIHAGIDALYTLGWDPDVAADAVRAVWGDYVTPPTHRAAHLTAGFCEIVVRNYADDRNQDAITPLRLRLTDLLIDHLGPAHAVEADDEGFVRMVETALSVTWPNGAIYGGKIDLPCTVGGAHAIIDHKTSSRWITENWAHSYAYSHQLRNYVAMMRLLTGLPFDRAYVNGIYTGREAADDLGKWKSRTSSRSALFGPYIYTPQMLQESQEWASTWLKTADFYTEHGVWPQNDRSCMKYGSPCEFYEICRRSPHVRDAIIRGEYTQRTLTGVLASGADSD